METVVADDRPLRTARFRVFALFDGEHLSPGGYLIDATVLVLISLPAYRLNQTGKMVRQYP